MEYKSASPLALAQELGNRLKLARLNLDLTQTQVAQRSGVSRKQVMQAEKGKTQLQTLIAILMALDVADQLDLFLPKTPISPLQLLKLQGKQRQRASGLKPQLGASAELKVAETTPAW